MIQLFINNVNDIFVNRQIVLHETIKSHDAPDNEKCHKFTKLGQLYVECSPDLSFCCFTPLAHKRPVPMVIQSVFDPN
jgi:hypothetical protein